MPENGEMCSGGFPAAMKENNFNQLLSKSTQHCALLKQALDGSMLKISINQSLRSGNYGKAKPRISEVAVLFAVTQHGLAAMVRKLSTKNAGLDALLTDLSTRSKNNCAGDGIYEIGHSRQRARSPVYPYLMCMSPCGSASACGRRIWDPLELPVVAKLLIFPVLPIHLAPSMSLWDFVHGIMQRQESTVPGNQYRGCFSSTGRDSLQGHD
ncbi:hypothetical protein STEG23_025937 [Scotinomys teguina]